MEEKNLYYYHPDHLGSSSYITDKNGEVIQHTEYMAFGETFVDEHSVNNKQPYLFNGKELDYETGLYYYGARYYDPKTSIFLNVDPLVEKTGTPYAYAYNNPINLIDPTGEIPILPLLLKAGVGGTSDLLAQATMEYMFNPSVNTWDKAFDNINWWQVARSSIEGAMPWKIPGGRIGKATLTASVDVLVNAIYQKNNYSMEQAGQDFATGFIGELAGEGIGDLIGKYGSKNVANGLKKIGFDADQIKKYTGIDLLSSSERSAINGLEKQLKEHEKKLKDYIANPDAFDNKGFLNGKTKELREKIINSRINSLKKQINTFRKDINSIKNFDKKVLEKQQ